MSVTIRTDDPIAVVGYWCRVPGALDPSQFWQNLCGRQESIATIPVGQLRDAGISEDLIANPLYVPRRGLLAEADAFDANLFGIPPVEAAMTDLQHRQFLECAWLALADAGYCPDVSLGRFGVFAAQSANRYIETSWDRSLRESQRFQAEMYCAPGHLASSVAYRLNLEGPALSVQTACSSSLVAVHLACRALQAGDCDGALAGGVSIGWPQTIGHLHQEGGIMSRDGHCRPFDRDASGTVRGEGVGVVMLKRLEDALQDRDSVRAVILGSAVSSDGGNRAGYSAPSAAGQARTIREAMRRANISPKEVQYIEAHGTATSLGDAIELDALQEVMAAPRKLLVGSVKGNIGHLDAAAGIVSLIKTVMMLEHHRVLPTLHHRSFSSELGSAPNLVVPSDAIEWPKEALVAGVSSFGLGGTNAHLVVGAPTAETHSTEECDDIVLLSAATSESLTQLQTDLAAAIRTKPGISLRDIAHTFAVGRRSMRFRRAIAVSSVADLALRLDDGCGTDFADSSTPAAFEFGDSMNGAAVRWFASLYASDLALRAAFDRLSDKVSMACRIDPRENLLSQQVDHTVTLLAACAGYALARRMVNLGVRPAWVSGRGVGQAVAAAIAGAIDIDLLAGILAAFHAHQGGSDLEDALATRLDEGAFGVSALTWKSAYDGELVDPRQATTAGTWAALLQPQGPRQETEPLTIGDGGRRLGGAHGPPALELLGRCWELGAPHEHNKSVTGIPARRIPLPHPRLERTRFAPSVAIGRARAEALAAGTGEPTGTIKTEHEEFVTSAVRDVLGIVDVHISSNFFEIGGCSLTALDLYERLRAAAGDKISLHDIFDAPSLAEIARCLKAAPESPRPKEPPDFKTHIVEMTDLGPSTAMMDLAGVANNSNSHTHAGPSFSIFFFSGDSVGHSQDLYELVLEATRFCDQHGFEAVWLPERHFHRFGGAFPAPAVLASAIAATTTRVKVRAGSVVIPLHHPLRVVEEWSVVDRLSRGRAGISFAPGFHPTDFVDHEAAYDTRRKTFWPAVDLVRRLWRGESYRATDGTGRSTEVLVHPAPSQRELPVWITASDKQETFVRAGEIGANVLSALMGQTLDQLAANIAAYRNARRAAGHGDRGKVTVMLHTFVHRDTEVVNRIGQSALRRYLEIHLNFASLRSEYDRTNELNTDDRSAMLEHAVKKYMSGRSLICTPAECHKRVALLSDIGVDEIACLVDFGPAHQDILRSLEEVALLIDHARSSGETAATSSGGR